MWGFILAWVAISGLIALVIGLGVSRFDDVEDFDEREG